MRILLLQESDWIEKGPHQGHHVMERLRERGHDVLVVDFEIRWADRKGARWYSPRKIFENAYKVVEGGGVTVVRPGFVRLPLIDYATSIVTHWMEIHRQVHEFHPDIIVGLGILNAFIGIRVARQMRIPFVYYLLDELHRLVPQPILRGGSKVIEQANMRRASLVISINESLRQYTVEMGAPPASTKVIRAGIDLARYASTEGRTAVRGEMGLREDDILLFFMGWLYPFSGLRQVAEEVLRQSASSKRVALLVVGKGELWDELGRLAQSDNTGGRIRLIGWQPYGLLPRYLAASDICLLPAERHEIMMNIVPIKVYEYMAASKPVIATRLPGLVKEFSQGNGVIYIDAPKEAVAKAMEIDRTGVLNSLGALAREFVAKNDWASITTEFERTLMSLTLRSRRTWR